MKKKINLLLSLICVFVGLCSCSPDNDDPDNDDEVPTEISTETEEKDTLTQENDKSVEMYYTVVCGSKLLKLVEPEVTYTEADGTETTITLTSNDWKPKSWAENMETGETEVGNYYWEKQIHFGFIRHFE